jgi:large subunit ribosomal protein L17
MLANMAANLIIHKQIRTTHPKALETRRLVETLITKAKRGDLHARRQVLRVIPQKDVVRILFDDIAPQYAEREGGYTRIIKLGQRKNDAAPVSLLALVDFDPSGEFKPESKQKKSKAKPAPKAEPVAAPVETETAEEEPAVEEAAAEETTEEAAPVEAEATETAAEAPAEDAAKTEEPAEAAETAEAPAEEAADEESGSEEKSEDAKS